MRAQFIYEKFTQDSDPVKDLGIGSYKILFEKELNYVKPMYISDVAEYFFNDRKCPSSARCVKDIMNDILLMNNFNIDNMNKIFIYHATNYRLNKYGKKIVKNYFKQKFNIKFSFYKKTV